MLEWYGPEIKYIKGTDNDAEDALSRILLINSDIVESNITRKHLPEIYCVEKLYSKKFPLTYRTIDKNQRKDKNMAGKIKSAQTAILNLFVEAEINSCLSVKIDKISVPTIFQKYVVNWYHNIYYIQVRSV